MAKLRTFFENSATTKLRKTPYRNMIEQNAFVVTARTKFDRTPNLGIINSRNTMPTNA